MSEDKKIQVVIIGHGKLLGESLARKLLKEGIGGVIVVEDEFELIEQFKSKTP